MLKNLCDVEAAPGCNYIPKLLDRDITLTSKKPLICENGVQVLLTYPVGVPLTNELQLGGTSKRRKELANIVQFSILAALDHAHQKGVLHLDVRPANIVLIHDFRDAMLVDWGLAHSLEDDWVPQFRGVDTFVISKMEDRLELDVAFDYVGLLLTLVWILRGDFEVDGVIVLLPDGVDKDWYIVDVATNNILYKMKDCFLPSSFYTFDEDQNVVLIGPPKKLELRNGATVSRSVALPDNKISKEIINCHVRHLVAERTIHSSEFELDVKLKNMFEKDECGIPLYL